VKRGAGAFGVCMAVAAKRRARAYAAAALAGAALTLVGAAPVSASTSSVNDTGHLRLLKAVGAVLLEEGKTTGTLPGTARVRLVVGASVSATFTITLRGGSISGSGKASLHSSGRCASFGGTLTVSRGSGRYAKARGAGKLYGVIDRRTDAVTVQTVGTLRY
jgi:hypothetical protein